MKRLLTMLLTVTIALAAYPAFAAVNGTPHDFLNSTYGRCGTCHVPHAAQGARRLWRESISFTLASHKWSESAVGALCAYCHITGGGGTTINNISSISTTGRGRQATVFDDANTLGSGPGSHGRKWSKLAGLGSASPVINGKPYTTGTQPDAGYMECTSCHNPHDEGKNAGDTGVRPFLRAGAAAGSTTTIAGVCRDCHDDRYTSSIVSSTNHPVLIQYNPVAAGTRLMRQAITEMNTPVGAMTWSLGGKFEGNQKATVPQITTALIGCQSCHSIHVPAAQLLAAVYANSTICEGCHSARGNGGSVGTGGDHPYDAVLLNVMVLDGALWTTTDKGTNGGAICTSCHKAHGAGTTYIRRAGSANWCTSCHTSVAPAAHHSNKTQLATAQYNCVDCHGSAGSTAHNGFGYTFILLGSGGCQSCHGAADPVTGLTGGVTAVPNAHLTAKAGTGTAVSHYMGTFTNDAASHTKGINVKTGRWSLDGIRGGRISAYLLDSAGVPLVSDRSCYNPTAGASATMVIRCESCHSVLGNIGATTGIISASSGWTNNLLLQDFQDDSKGEALARTVNSDLCIGCHNQINGDDASRKLGSINGVVGMSLEKESTTVPPNMHPMTNWNITRAVDAGRTPTTLLTGSPTYANAAGAPAAAGGVGTNGVSYPSTDHMDCDSCHRPHLGNLNWAVTNKTAGNGGATTPVILEDGSTNAGLSDYGALCQDCHAY